MFKKILSTVLAAAMLASTVSATVSSGREPQVLNAAAMLLRYDEPASSTNSRDTWQEATLPIGNGILGANVYGETTKDHLTVNEETLWSGGRGSVANYNGGNPSTSKVDVYNGYASTLLTGGSVNNNIENLKGLADGYNNGYQALGDLYFTFDSSSSSNYLRTLDLDKGEATVSLGNYKRTYFASNPHNVIVSRFEATDGSKIGVTTQFTSQQSATTSASVSENVGYITVAGTVSNNSLQHNTQIAVVPEGGSVSVSGSNIVVSNADAVTVYLTAATDYKNTFWDNDHSIEYYYRTGETAAELSARVNGVLTSAVDDGFQTVYAAHQADYQNLYQRVELDLGQDMGSKMTDELLTAYKNGSANAAEQRYLEVLMFQYGRYLLISGSRENSQLPTTLQGIWNNSNSAPWNSDIHVNINEEMNYWLSGNCNLPECELPLVNYVASLAIPGHKTVETYTGAAHGIMSHTQNTPYGFTAPGWVIDTWGWSPAAAAWLMQNCFDYYEYSGDVETLRDVIYPFLKEQVLMYQELLEDFGGRKVMPITQSPELATISAGNTYEQSLIWQLYADTIEAAELLGLDADQVPTWQATMDALNPIEIGTSGQVKEWYNETSTNSVNNTSAHRHLSNLLGLYPGDLFNTDEYLAAAAVSLNNKNFGKVGTTSNNPEGGWTYAQMMSSWARVGDGENAYFNVSQMLKNKVYANLWDFHNKDTYGAFQIDGNYGYSAGVGEMLVQSNLGYINMLPALPNAWANGSVSGLLCEGGFEVTMAWTAKALTSASITSKNGGTCGVKLAAGQVVRDASGDIVAAAPAEGGVVSFQTVSGGVYTIEESNLHASATRNWDGSVTVTWNAEPGESYTVNGVSATSPFVVENAPEDAASFVVASASGVEAAASVDPVIIAISGETHISGFEQASPNSISDGIYMIVGARNNYSKNKAMKSDASLLDISSHISSSLFSTTTAETFDGMEAYLWEVKSVSGGYTVQNLTTGEYLTMDSSDSEYASMGEAPVTLSIATKSSSSKTVAISNAATGAYLNYRQNTDSAGTYNTNDDGCAWYMFKATGAEADYAKTPSADVVGGKYLIVGTNSDSKNKSQGKAVNGDLSFTDISSFAKNSYDYVAGLNDDSAMLWEVTPVSGGFTVKNVSTGMYLEMENSDTVLATLSTSPVVLQIENSTFATGGVFVHNAATGAYLNYRGTAGTYTSGDAGGTWYLFRALVKEDTYTVNPQIIASASAAVENGSDSFQAALAAAQATFATYEDAYAAYEALQAAVRAEGTPVDPEPDCPHEEFDLFNWIPVTCTEDGYTGDAYCLTCGALLLEGETIPAAGHLPDTYGYRRATCTEDGYTGDTVCLFCEEMLGQGEVVPAIGHNYIFVGAKEATCTSIGYTGDMFCANCGDVSEHGTVIPALGHAWDNGVNTKAPTCTEEGIKTFTCGRCDETKTEVLAMVDHSFDSKKICTSCGLYDPYHDLVDLSVATTSGLNRVKLTGAFKDLENKSSYHVVGQGVVYINKLLLGSRELTVDTFGRSKATCSSMDSQGNWYYTISTGSASTTYVARAYVIVRNAQGNLEYVYSDPVTFSYKTAGKSGASLPFAS